MLTHVRVHYPLPLKRQQQQYTTQPTVNMAKNANIASFGEIEQLRQQLSETQIQLQKQSFQFQNVIYYV